MKRTRFVGISVLAGLLVGIFGLLAGSASAATPAPGYEQFRGCPTKAEAPTVESCIRTLITGGNFKMGSKNVPITNPITLTGGTEANLANVQANSEGGLQPVKEKVPGGVVGLTGLTWLLEVLGSEALTLYAVTELVGQPQVSLENTVLPIRVHLVNSVLGNSCFVGSPANPITLHLTTGTTSPPAPAKPITGRVPEFHFNVEKELLDLTNGIYVDNSFAAPAASGCTLTLFGFIPINLDSLVDAQAGLPAKAGTNEAVQDFNFEAAPVKRVYP